MTRSFFYDTWAFVALANRRDEGHSIARELDEALERAAFSPVTTDYIVDETVTFLQGAAGSAVSLGFLGYLEARVTAGDLRLLEIGASRRQRAIEVFRRLAPDEAHFSFTDATSFVVMRELEIDAAFSADRHFFCAGGGIAPLVERKGSRLVARSIPGI